LPNIKSAIKRVRISKKKTLQNSMRKSILKTNIKKCKQAIANNEPNAVEALKLAIKTIDKAAAKNIIHKTPLREKNQACKGIERCPQTTIKTYWKVRFYI